MSRTKAERKQERRGRATLPATERERNGRPSRRMASISEREHALDAVNREVAVSRRIRHMDLRPRMARSSTGEIVELSPEQQALDPRLGYVLGQLTVRGKFTEMQHEAGVRIAEDAARFYGLVVGKFPSVRAQNLFAVRGNDGEESEDRIEAAKRARQTFMRLQEAIGKGYDINTGRRIAHCLKELCILDNGVAHCWPEPMFVFARKGLNRAADFYGIKRG